MTAALRSVAEEAAAFASVAVDALLEADVSQLSDDEFLALARSVETVRRRLETFDNVVVPEVERRNLAGRSAIQGGPHRLLGPVWHQTSAAARERTRQADALTPR